MNKLQSVIKAHYMLLNELVELEKKIKNNSKLDQWTKEYQLNSVKEDIKLERAQLRAFTFAQRLVEEERAK